MKSIKNIFFKQKCDDVYKKNKKKRDFKKIKKYFDYIKDNKYSSDDYTWNDLNMNEVYSRIDNTATTAGEQILYKILRTPLFDKKALKQRGENISFFKNNPKKKHLLHRELSKLSTTDSDVVSVLTNEIKPNLKLKLLLILLAVSSISSIILFAITSVNIFLFSFMLLFIFNMRMHYKMTTELYEKIKVLQYISKMLSITNKVANIIQDDIEDYNIRLKNIYKKCKGILKKTSVILKVEGFDVIGDYINIMLFIKEMNYLSIAPQIEKYKSEILELYKIIGELDSYISIDTYRDEIENYCEPEFVNENRYLIVEDMIHPLLKDPINNSINVKDGGVIITGSNMSGKSTFMRTIGVNALCAQTIYTCFATKYECSFFNVVSSISLNDDILEGKSYYLGEAEAIHRIIYSSKDNVTCLGLIDEIFKGTNPVERINAAAEILNYLSETNAVTIVATHDLQLIPMLKGYKSYYFKEDVTQYGMVFDYKIRKGISSTRNAIKILEYLKYPDEILGRINERLKLQNVN